MDQKGKFYLVVVIFVFTAHLTLKIDNEDFVTAHRYLQPNLQFQNRTILNFLFASVHRLYWIHTKTNANIINKLLEKYFEPLEYKCLIWRYIGGTSALYGIYFRGLYPWKMGPITGSLNPRPTKPNQTKQLPKFSPSKITTVGTTLNALYCPKIPVLIIKIR